MKRLIILLLVTLLPTLAFGQTGDFDIITGGVSVASKTYDLRVPTQLTADGSVSTDSIVDGSVTNAKVATGTFAELNGQTTEDFAAKDLDVNSWKMDDTNGDTQSGMYAAIMAPDAVYTTDMAIVANASFGNLEGSEATEPRAFSIANYNGALSNTINADTTISLVKDNAGTLNFYAEGGFLVIQNKRVGNAYVCVSWRNTYGQW